MRDFAGRGLRKYDTMEDGMRRRFQLSEGKLVDRRGYELPMVVFARSPLLGCVLEITPEDAALIEGRGGKGVGVEVSEVEVDVELREVREELPLTPTDRIWDAYVATMSPRRTELDPQTAVVIRDALKVATEEECIGAIRGCAKSRFHMGDNDRHRKYNSVSQILRGKRGVRTTREQIDLMLTYDEATVSGELPSGALAEVEKAKGIVQRYGYFTNHDQAAELVRAATAVLADHGIDVVTARGKLQGEDIVESIVFSDGVRA